MKEKIEKILSNILLEIGKELETDVFKNINEETMIYDNLDSMAVLDFILEIEDAFQKEFGRYIQVADEMTMDSKQTPLKSFGTTVDMLLIKVQNG